MRCDSNPSCPLPGRYYPAFIWDGVAGRFGVNKRELHTVALCQHHKDGLSAAEVIYKYWKHFQNILRRDRKEAPDMTDVRVEWFVHRKVG